MEASPVTTASCNLCSLLQFDDLAAGCREVVDEEGRARLSFEDAKVESRNDEDGNKFYNLIRLRWHLDDSLPDLPRLSDSSRAGCAFCEVLLIKLKSAYDLRILSSFLLISDGDVSLNAYISLVEGGIDGIVVELVSDAMKHETGKLGSYREFFPVEASLGCQKWLGAVPARHGGYLTSENTSEICRVLGECTANCHPWEASSLPTRLIDIGTGVSDLPRLALSSDILITAETKYAALSYCWGNKEDAKAQLKTETATLGDRLQGIALDTMTPAIRDAVELTRAVGLRYIWIDALCIIQDDPADWSYESGQMDRVFKNAYVTFCALVSTSCQKSFLQRRPAFSVPFQSAIRPSINGNLSVRLQPISADWTIPESSILDRFVSRWNNRAWTFQEEKLSTRLLLFGGSKMHFQCGTYQWSEGDDKFRRLEDSTSSLFDRIAGIKRGEHPASTLYDHWYILVHDYAHRELTCETDRLPAMSGLARLVGETLGDQYLAGLWKGDILIGLSWESVPHTTFGLQHHLQRIREREYIAPSWSWAACDENGVDPGFSGWQTVPECTVLDTDVKTDSKNRFGKVYGGFLRIRGKVAPIPHSLREGGRRGDNASKWRLKLGGEFENITADLDWRAGHDDEGLENLIMLLLHTRNPPEQLHDSSGKRICEALILYPTETPGEYYRVGVVHSGYGAACDLMRTWFEGEGNEKICTII
ncbi:hypothetical protein KVR01_011660 [Diaporthe batatas]|uniref:uncharacterized protein n=1 Tax=Diaporthe batatas TaxID=748121 RepID=UPI001D035F29|nr:uncharacterized protein KVR01_011660 [Diaporthe batatas]KAG8158538.1 hypothetical protein KVR01_011660 [Diaporthe batatas]